MLIIRLTRVGKKKKPVYRVVLAEHEKGVQNKYIEMLGQYNPMTKEVVLKEDRIRQCLKNGAQISDAMAKILNKYAQDKKIIKDFGIDKRIEILKNRPKKAKKEKVQKKKTGEATKVSEVTNVTEVAKESKKEFSPVEVSKDQAEKPPEEPSKEPKPEKSKEEKSS